jgi:hypothetical protein
LSISHTPKNSFEKAIYLLFNPVYHHNIHPYTIAGHSGASMMGIADLNTIAALGFAPRSEEIIEYY